MITVEEAEKILTAHLFQTGAEWIALEKANARVLAEPLVADRDFPPFDRVTMDGIAINFDSYEKGIRQFGIEKVIAAGAPPYALQDPKACIEIMTGAVLPGRTDTIIRYEDFNRSGNTVTIAVESVTRGQNVHRRGSDQKSGDILIPEGKLIGPPEIGVAATIGKSQIKVRSLPKVAVITTGDELVGVDQQPEPHQIRASNGFTIKAALEDLGIDAVILHVSDNQSKITAGIEVLLSDFDVMIFIGGSSKGKYDLIPDTLKSFGVTEHFYRVKQRPGKPLWFGSRDSKNFVFALPGNPTSCFMCFEKYFKPWIENSLGLSKKESTAQLKGCFQFEPELTYFLQVSLVIEDGVIFAKPVPGKGSGDLANLPRADAFMQLPANQSEFKDGDIYPVIPYR